MNDVIVMYDAPEAATWKTGISGWVNNKGHFYGDDEHMARWSSCTHKKCDECGHVNRRSSYCVPCRDKKMAEKFDTFPVEKWDGETPLCIFDSDHYFFDDEVLDFLADLPEGEEVRICKCKAGRLALVSEDNWCDDLAEDGELPDEVATALAALNIAIREAMPVSWWQDSIAIDVADLKSRITP